MFMYMYMYMYTCRVLDEAGHDFTDVLIRGTKECPRSAELFHLAARLSLSRHTKDSSQPTASLEKAVEWLQCCVSNFFKIPPGSNTELDQTLMLYRWTPHLRTVTLYTILVVYSIQYTVCCQSIHTYSLLAVHATRQTVSIECVFFYDFLGSFFIRWYPMILSYLSLQMELILPTWASSWPHCGSAIGMIHTCTVQCRSYLIRVATGDWCISLSISITHVYTLSCTVYWWSWLFLPWLSPFILSSDIPQLKKHTKQPFTRYILLQGLSSLSGWSTFSTFAPGHSKRTTWSTLTISRLSWVLFIAVSWLLTMSNLCHVSVPTVPRQRVSMKTTPFMIR